MPFHLRTVEPQRVCRLKGKHRKARGEDSSFVLVDGRKVRKPILFSSLEDVCSQTLTGILLQLSDLSRYASDIFLDIESQAGLISQRSRKIQVRLEILQNTVRTFDPKKTKIREWHIYPIYSPVYLARFTVDKNKMRNQVKHD